MSLSEIISATIGALGIGGGVMALYIRGTIAETIIVRLNGRYVASPICLERHGHLTGLLERIERQAEKLEQKVEDGFDNLRRQVEEVQGFELRVEQDQIRREKNVRGRLDDREAATD